MDKFLEASSRTGALLAGRVGKDGRLTDAAVRDELNSQYKLTSLLVVCGYTEEAHRLLDRIKKDFMQADGDFVSYPSIEGRERKSKAFPMTHYWTYMNAWIGMGAQRLGRFDISIPAFNFCKRFFNPTIDMVCVTDPYDEMTSETTVDTMSTAHTGLFSLYMGDVTLATRCGEGLLKFMAKQPSIDTELYLRAYAKTGNIITDAPSNMVPFYVIKKDLPKQLYFFLGYHGFFMTKLYQATGDQRFLDSAKWILDWAMTCHESLCTFSFSHKVAYAASLVAVETKEAKYRRLAIGIGEYLLSIQNGEGFFCENMDRMDMYDQTEEIGVWLRELNNELKKLV